MIHPSPARVYAILSAQLIVTALFCALFGLHPTLSNLTILSRSGDLSPALAAIPLVSVLVSTISWFIVCLNPKARRTAPTKWWLLVLFTLGESISVGFLSSFYHFRSVVMAMGATALASITVSMYTILQSNPDRDLSQWGASLSS
jgi:FtsH-binding integral membrane protein